MPMKKEGIEYHREKGIYGKTNFFCTQDGELMELRSKMWLIKDNRPIIGTGRALLLNLIKEKGSIAGAAQEMKMSYRTAWGKIKSMEDRLGYSVVESRAGGGSGGSTLLTKEGKEILEKYLFLISTVNETAETTFHRLFKK